VTVDYEQAPVDVEAPEYHAARDSESRRSGGKKTGDARRSDGDKDEATKQPSGGETTNEEPPPKKLKDRPALLVVVAIVILAAIAGGIIYWLDARQYETTDDAYVDGHIVRIAPEVAGYVREVRVDDNQLVGPRTVLVIIDTAQNLARYAGLVAQAKQARATVVQSQAQVGATAQQIAAARANVIQPQADLIKAQADLARYRTLLAIEPAAVAAQQIDTSIQAVGSARGRRDAAAKQVRQAEAQLVSSKAQVGADRAAVTAADANARSTAIELTHGQVTSPIFGRVANRAVDPGSYVSPGQQLLAIVPLKLYVTANFKETQLRLMRVGQPVTMRIDTVPDVEFRGHVASFQQGAGQAFALLPAENATGNFVKVVQRVPVRIAIDSPAIQAYPVGPGMSVVPRVKVR